MEFGTNRDDERITSIPNRFFILSCAFAASLKLNICVNSMNVRHNTKALSNNLIASSMFPLKENMDLENFQMSLVSLNNT